MSFGQARGFAVVAAVAFVTLSAAGSSAGGERNIPVLSAAKSESSLPPAEIRKPRSDPFDMLVSALTACANRLGLRERERLARIIETESSEHGYDPLFITALMQVESGCLPTANGNGAIGLVQLMPSTARAVARRLGVPWRGERTLTEPASNIQLGVHYLREMEELFNDPFRAVAAYNLGPVRVARMSSGRARQTIYVRKVLSRYERLLEQFT
jgi:soluble lytic murein transglycosylase-like protein